VTVAAAQPVFQVAGAGHTALAFSPDNQWLAIVRSDGWLLLRDAASGKPMQEYSLGGALSAVRFTSDASALVVGTATGELRMVVRGNGKEVWRRLPHSDRVVSVAFSPDGRYLLSASANGELELSSAVDGKPVQRLRSDSMPLLDAQYSPDGRYVAAVLGDGRSQVVKVVEVGSGRELLSTAAGAASFSVNGRYLLVAAGGHTPVLFDIATGRELQRFARFPNQIVAGAYAESGDHVATVDVEGRGVKLDTRNGQPVAAVRAAPLQPRATAFSSDVARYALIDEQGRVAVYRFQE